jgi:hypothetical protein
VGIGTFTGMIVITVGVGSFICVAVITVGIGTFTGMIVITVGVGSFICVAVITVGIRTFVCVIVGTMGICTFTGMIGIIMRLRRSRATDHQWFFRTACHGRGQGQCDYRQRNQEHRFQSHNCTPGREGFQNPFRSPDEILLPDFIR